MTVLLLVEPFTNCTSGDWEEPCRDKTTVEQSKPVWMSHGSSVTEKTKTVFLQDVVTTCSLCLIQHWKVGKQTHTTIQTWQAKSASIDDKRGLVSGQTSTPAYQKGALMKTTSNKNSKHLNKITLDKGSVTTGTCWPCFMCTRLRKPVCLCTEDGDFHLKQVQKSCFQRKRLTGTELVPRSKQAW